MITVTVLSAIAWGSVAELVQIAHTEIAVDKIHAIHHSVIGPRSRTWECSARANSIKNTGAHTRFTTGMRQPAHNSHSERGSSRPWNRNTSARRPISHEVMTAAVTMTATIAARLTNTPISRVPLATSGGRSLVRLMSSSR